MVNNIASTVTFDNSASGNVEIYDNSDPTAQRGNKEQFLPFEVVKVKFICLH